MPCQPLPGPFLLPILKIPLRPRRGYALFHPIHGAFAQPEPAKPRETSNFRGVPNAFSDVKPHENRR